VATVQPFRELQQHFAEHVHPAADFEMVAELGQLPASSDLHLVPHHHRIQNLVPEV
jgi:hypothetical protein